MNVSYWSLTCTIYYLYIILGSRIRVYYLWPVGWSTWEHCCQSCGLVICPACSTRVVDIYQNQGCTLHTYVRWSWIFSIQIVHYFVTKTFAVYEWRSFVVLVFQQPWLWSNLSIVIMYILIYHFITSSVHFHFILDFSTWPYFVFQFFFMFFSFIVCGVAKACIRLSLKIHRY